MNLKERSVTSREFPHQFARISKRLRPGQTIIVTSRGEKLGTFTRAVKPPKNRPDFLGNLRKLGHSKEVGQRLIDQIVNRSEERRVGKECRSRWSPYH